MTLRGQFSFSVSQDEHAAILEAAKVLEEVPNAFIRRAVMTATSHVLAAADADAAAANVPEGMAVAEVPGPLADDDVAASCDPGDPPEPGSIDEEVERVL